MNLAPSPNQSAYFTAFRAFLLSILPAGLEVVQQQDNRVPQPAGTDFVTLNEVGRRRLSANITTYTDCTFSGSVQGSVLTVTQVRLGVLQLGSVLLATGVLSGTTILSQQSGSNGGAGVYTLSQAQQTPIAGVPLASGAALILQPTEIRIQVDVYGPGSADNTATVTTLLRDGYAALWFARQGYSAQGIDFLDIDEARQMPFVDGEEQYEDRWSFDVKLQANQVVSPSQDFADSITLETYVADSPAAEGGTTATPSLLPGQSVSASGGVVSSSFTGFGFIRYFELGGANATPLVLAPGARTPLTMTIDPTQTVNALKGSFATQTFWDGSTLTVEGINDTIDIQVTFSAVSIVSGGTVLLEMQYAGDGGPIRAQVCPLPEQAGSTQRIFVIFKLFGSALLLAQGAQFYLTSSVPLSLVQETILIEPTNAGP